MNKWTIAGRYLAAHWKGFAAILIPLALLPIPLVIGNDESKCGAVILGMAIYWMFDILPLAGTALAPVAIFPLVGLASTNTVSMQYMRSTNMLFLGGLICAAGVEHCNLHRRIALNAMRFFGSSPHKLLLGVVVPCGVLSMWISNTATTAMMIPIVEAILRELGDGDPKNDKERKKYLKNLRAMLAMGICFSANTGGTGTIIGSTPNLAFSEYLEEFPDQPVSFGSYMGFSVPQMILCLMAVYFWLQFYYFGFASCRSRHENGLFSAKLPSSSDEVLKKRKRMKWSGG